MIALQQCDREIPILCLWRYLHNSVRLLDFKNNAFLRLQWKPPEAVKAQSCEDAKLKSI